MKKLLLLLVVYYSIELSASAQATLNLTFFIQGYYDAIEPWDGNPGNTHLMLPVQYIQVTNSDYTLNYPNNFPFQVPCNVSIPPTANDVDDVTIEFHADAWSVNHTVNFSHVDKLQTDGSFPPFSVTAGDYYIVIKNRSCVETWSASKVHIPVSGLVNYDFSTAANKAFGSPPNQILVDNVNGQDRFAIYNGDINQDGSVDLLDFDILSFDLLHLLYGCYVTDLNGDGSVDLIDYPIWEYNKSLGIGVKRP